MAAVDKPLDQWIFAEGYSSIPASVADTIKCEPCESGAPPVPVCDGPGGDGAEVINLSLLLSNEDFPCTAFYVEEIDRVTCDDWDCGAGKYTEPTAVQPGPPPALASP